MLITHITNSTKQTQKIASDLAKKVLRNGLEDKAIVLLLKGDLGAGKTTFLQGFAKGLGIKQKVLSPTFVIQKKFSIKNAPFKFFYHIDCYRMESANDILHLGFKENLNISESIIAIEWPEKITKLLPKKNIKLELLHIDEKQRKIKINI